MNTDIFFPQYFFSFLHISAIFLGSCKNINPLLLTSNCKSQGIYISRISIFNSINKKKWSTRSQALPKYIEIDMPVSIRDKLCTVCTANLKICWKTVKGEELAQYFCIFLSFSFILIKMLVCYTKSIGSISNMWVFFLFLCYCFMRLLKSVVSIAEQDGKKWQ